jgi:hypothetical protein
MRGFVEKACPSVRGSQMTKRNTPSAKTGAAKIRGAKIRGVKTRGVKSPAGHKSARAPESADEQTSEDQISYSGLSLHDLFQQQTRQMLARADLNEEEKQNILIAMSCPCCGAGAMSYTVKLKR